MGVSRGVINIEKEANVCQCSHQERFVHTCTGVLALPLAVTVMTVLTTARYTLTALYTIQRAFDHPRQQKSLLIGLTSSSSSAGNHDAAPLSASQASISLCHAQAAPHTDHSRILFARAMDPAIKAFFLCIEATCIILRQS